MDDHPVNHDKHDWCERGKGNKTETVDHGVASLDGRGQSHSQCSDQGHSDSRRGHSAGVVSNADDLPGCKFSNDDNAHIAAHD